MYFDCSGMIHIHSLHSHDGRRSVDEITIAAKRCGIDFVIITDHGNRDAAACQGWMNGVLVIVGQEISPRYNHYLALGLDEEIRVREEGETDPREYVEAVAKKGGIGIIAHPDHEGVEMFHVKHFPWIDWSLSGYEGIGVWDFMTDWQSSLGSLPLALLSYLLPAFFLKGPKAQTLHRWDCLNRRTRIFGIGELDNHDTPYSFLGLNVGVFPFRRAFRFVGTHVLLERSFTGDGEIDGRLVLEALRGGRAYAALEYFGSPKGFSFMIRGRDMEGTLGDEVTLTGRDAFHIRLPRKGRVLLVRDGEKYYEGQGTFFKIPAKNKGVYRVESYLRILGRYRPWIFSNPIYVR